MSQENQDNPEIPMPLEPELLALEQELLSLKPLEMDFPTGTRVMSALQQEEAAFKAIFPALQAIDGDGGKETTELPQSRAWRSVAPWAVAAALAVTGWVAFDQLNTGRAVSGINKGSANTVVSTEESRNQSRATVQMVFPSAQGEQVPFGAYPHGVAREVAVSPLAAGKSADGPSRVHMFPEATSPYGFMGVRAYDLSADYCRRLGINHGLVVEAMGTDSPAAQHGLELGDVIVAYNNFPIDTVTEFAEIVRNTPPGSSVTLTIIRGRMKGEIKICLGSAPSA